MQRAAELRRELGYGAGSVVLIHPGSGSPRKCVKPAVWSHAIAACRRAGMHVCLLEGPADRNMCESVRALVPDLMIVRNHSLETVAGLLSLATLYVGLDSGISHLAAFIGCRAVALFVVTDRARWRPLGDHVTVVTALSSDAMSAALHAQLTATRLVPSVDMC